MRPEGNPVKTIAWTLIALLLTGCMTTEEKNRELLSGARLGDVTRVQEMIRRGADLSVRDEYGDTALHLAIRQRHKEMISLLVQEGADVNAQGALGYSPLHLSVYHGETTVSGLLRDQGADEDLLNRYGLRPADMESVPGMEETVVDAAKLLEADGDWTDPEQARTLYDRLKEMDASLVTNSIVLQVILNEPVRPQVLLLAIKLGLPESERQLAALLMVYGTKDMAEDYMNSGSPVLALAARKWANRRSYGITQGHSGSNRAKWGTF